MQSYDLDICLDICLSHMFWLYDFNNTNSRQSKLDHMII